MSFVPADLQETIDANAFKIWRYATSEAADLLRTPGYFDAARERLGLGDMIQFRAGADQGTLVVSRHEPGLPLLVEPAVFDDEDDR